MGLGVCVLVAFCISSYYTNLFVCRGGRENVSACVFNAFDLRIEYFCALEWIAEFCYESYLCYVSSCCCCSFYCYYCSYLNCG